MQLREPLDFYAVTDHGFLMGNVEWWADPNNTTPGTESFTNLNIPENRTLNHSQEGGLCLLLKSEALFLRVSVLREW